MPILLDQRGGLDQAAVQLRLGMRRHLNVDDIDRHRDGQHREQRACQEDAVCERREQLHCPRLVGTCDDGLLTAELEVQLDLLRRLDRPTLRDSLASVSCQTLTVYEPGGTPSSR